MNDNITPTIVLEDIVWGEGFVEVPTYGGKTRQGTKISLANIPFDATKTVAQAMNEMTNLLNSQDYATIQANLTSIVTLRNNLQQLLNVKNQLDHILNVSNDIDAIRAISTRLPLLDNIEELIANIDKHTKYVEYALCQMKRDKDFIHKDIGEARKLVYGKIEPLVTAVTQARLELDTIISTARADVVSGHEMAVKLATYSLEIQAKPYCRTPKVIVDDTNEKIIWQVPTVKGDCSVITEIPTSLVQSAVDNYIKTLSINTDTDQSITQARVDEAFEIPRALTREELDELIEAHRNDRDNVEKQNAVINADTSEITDFSELFLDDDEFNLPIGSWDVGNVTTMKDMFKSESYSSFNQDVSNWDVSNVIDFERAFNGCYILNQDFSNWNTGSATNMTSMFNWCRPLDTDLSSWNVDNVIEYENFRKDTSITDEHTPSKFLPATGILRIRNDFSSEVQSFFIANLTTGQASQMDGIAKNGVFEREFSAGTYRLDVFQNGVHFYNSNNEEISQFDIVANETQEFVFKSNQNSEPIDPFELRMLLDQWDGDKNDITIQNQIINANVSQITDFSGLFETRDEFNLDISSWNVSSATNMRNMFLFASSFNQDISGWNVDNVTNFDGFRDQCPLIDEYTPLKFR